MPGWRPVKAVTTRGRRRAVTGAPAATDVGRVGRLGRGWGAGWTLGGGGGDGRPAPQVRRRHRGSVPRGPPPTAAGGAPPRPALPRAAARNRRPPRARRARPRAGVLVESPPLPRCGRGGRGGSRAAFRMRQGQEEDRVRAYQAERAPSHPPPPPSARGAPYRGRRAVEGGREGRAGRVERPTFVTTLPTPAYCCRQTANGLVRRGAAAGRRCGAW